MATESWSKFAVFYRLDSANIPPDGLRGITQRLDSIEAAGVDALWINPYQHDATQPSAQALDADNSALGTMADIDDLITAASRQKLRVVVDLPDRAPVETIRSIARFWLTRGAAGLYLKGSTNNAAVLHDLRKLESTFAGERILIADADAIQPGQPDDAHLRLRSLAPADTSLTATTLRSAIDLLQTATGPTGPLLLSLNTTAQPSGSEPLAQPLAAILMTSRSAITLSAGQLLPLLRAPVATPSASHSDSEDEPSRSFYRQLGVLHRSSSTLRFGDLTRLSADDPDTLIWLRRTTVRKGGAPSILVACNLSTHPVRLLLTPELARTRTRGRWMRTVLRSYPGFGPERADGLTLPPFGVYIGELHN